MLDYSWRMSIILSFLISLSSKKVSSSFNELIIWSFYFWDRLVVWSLSCSKSFKRMEEVWKPCSIISGFASSSRAFKVCFSVTISFCCLAIFSYNSPMICDFSFWMFLYFSCHSASKLCKSFSNLLISFSFPTSSKVLSLFSVSLLFKAFICSLRVSLSNLCPSIYA